MSKKKTRREFVQESAMLGVGLSAISGITGKSFASSSGQSGQPAFKVLESKFTKETAQFSFEITGTNGEPQVVRSYVRRIDHGDSYTVISHMSNSKLGPARTTIVRGVKGAVEGDYRLDQVTTETIFEDGTITPTPEKQTKVLTTDPYEGLNPQEKVDRFMQDKAAGRFEH